MTKPLHKLLLIGEAEEIQALYRAISADDFPSTAFYLSKANYLEVTAKHVSKEDALVELANHYHLSLEEVLTMGTTSMTFLCSKKQASVSLWATLLKR
ncbi:HAD hydrolase family protein [Streptococcus sp. 2A/TPW/M5]